MLVRPMFGIPILVYPIVNGMAAIIAIKRLFALTCSVSGHFHASFGMYFPQNNLTIGIATAGRSRLIIVTQGIFGLKEYR